MKPVNLILLAWLALSAVPPPLTGAQKTDFLTDEEQDKLREAQDPSERIGVYLSLQQARLDRFEEFRKKPADPQDDQGSYLSSLLDQYIALNDDLKDWIEFQYERHGDVRSGLRALLERGPRQLEELRRIEQSQDPYAGEYRDTLRAAIDDLTDTLDGATKALADQEKKFAATKREEKVEAQAAKQRRKGEEKRSKEEKKLRKRQHKRGVPTESDED